MAGPWRRMWCSGLCVMGCVHKECESGEQSIKRPSFVRGTCNGTGGKGKCRDAIKGANHMKAELTSLHLEWPSFLLNSRDLAY